MAKKERLRKVFVEVSDGQSDQVDNMSHNHARPLVKYIGLVEKKMDIAI